MEKATFAAGCFWGIENNFKNTKGVVTTASGYMGGSTPDPSYEDVCTGKTGHAEVVQVEYDSETISYTQLLNLFWEMHDPTTLNKQGPDIGTQYRSAIFFHTQAQEEEAMFSKSEYQKKINTVIVTEITQASIFYRAEEYHQCYLEKRGLGSCKI